MKKSNLQKIDCLDGLLYQQALLASCREIIAHEKELNKINVFPIPDKDTGVNLKKTLSPLLEEFPISSSVGETSQQMAEKAVSSALGYSGIIFAQFLAGFAEALKEYEKVLPEEFAQASTQGVIRAYEAISDPQEGTVLTVMKEWSEELKKQAPAIDDFIVLFRESLKTAAAALEKTPQKLEVLRKHNVVDAGGKAFVHFLEGWIDLMEKGEYPSKPFKKKRILVPKEKKDAKEELRFCAECCLRKKNIERSRLIEKLNSLGQDLIFYGSLNFAKIHLKTNSPEEVFTCAAQFGEVSSKKVFKFAPDLPISEKQALALTADTTCDIPDNYIEENDLYFIPVKFQTADRIYTDKVDVIPEEFYQILDASLQLPKTSQPSLMDFTQFFEHLLVHYRSLVSLQVSGKLSGTFQTALQAAHNIASQRIKVLDGKNVSVGLGLAMVEGITAAKQGLDHERVKERIENAIEEIEIIIGFPTIKYLVKGGRVSKAKGLVAGILNINPILSIDREGSLVPIGKTRGKKKLEQKIFDMALEKFSAATEKKGIEISTAVAHTNAYHLGIGLANRIKERLGKDVTMIMNASPVLGVHAGPGVVGLAFLKETK
ncbi:MAG: DegV family EDD domain-containing protein [Candidatus Aminicenantes bacterium]|nr:DegV family EDD domain-containing protein [Candidatus Aminicenantes bacterium]